MTPQQQGRFCDSCQKCVVDFTGFTDAQLHQFFAEHKGQKVCGRFRNTQLNRHIDIPPQPHSQLYKWIMAAGLALVFVAAPEGKVFAQAPLVTQTIASNQVDIPGDTSKKDETITIKGTVVDEKNEPVFNAVVQVMQDGVTKGGAVTDFNGNYRVALIKRDNYTLVVKYIGYNEHQVRNIETNAGETVTINVVLKSLVADFQTVETYYTMGLVDNSSTISENTPPSRFKKFWQRLSRIW